MGYKNPIPNVDDKEVAKKFYLSIQYKFDEGVTLEEAVDSIQEFIKEYGIPAESIHFAERPSLRGAGGVNENR